MHLLFDFDLPFKVQQRFCIIDTFYFARIDQLIFAEIAVVIEILLDFEPEFIWA